jgi:hypothetical protein
MAAAKGEKNTSAKLTEAQARAIRKDPRLGKQVADDYGISVAHVWRIRNRVKWRHLDEERQQ